MPDENLDLTQEVGILFEDIEVDQAEKDKFAIKLEAVITSKVAELKTQLQEENESVLADAEAELRNELDEDINKYLDYVVEQWMDENKLIVESGIKTDLVENFVDGLKDLMENNYIDIPEDVQDVVAVADEKIEALEADLAEQIDKSYKLNQDLDRLNKQQVVEHVASDLTDTQKEKLNTLVEDVEFSDVDAYSEKVKVIKESFFKANADEGVDISDDKTDDDENEEDNKMNAYLKAL